VFLVFYVVAYITVGIGDLSILQQVEDRSAPGGFSTPKTLFSISGAQGDLWLQGFVDIPSRQAYAIIVEGNLSSYSSFSNNTFYSHLFIG